MASVTTKTETITRYVLTLDQAEAEVLACILARVAGDPWTTRRTYASSIWYALHKVGLSKSVEDSYDDMKGTINFR